MKKEMAYYIFMFTLEGHTTWHATMARDEGGFQRATKGCKIKDRKTFRIDRVTGEIKAL